ncbi:MAG: fibronectin type III domain-containing protein [Erysipelotrichaceae bacterium]|nr:fibronectin type III domain-containing protein [Erysipelotrichaceae bacterium]
MRKGNELLKRIIIAPILFSLIMTAAFSALAGHVVHAEENAEGDGKSIYEQVEEMGNRNPQNWGSTTDPFGYGLDKPFFLNTQQELLMLRSKGVSGGNNMTSFDTLKSGNTAYPFGEAKHIWTKNLDGKYALSFIRSVAFDPTGSGRKDHVAYIGVYASKTNDPNHNPPYVQMWVMDKNGRTSNRIDVAKATWMCNDNTYNNANMWDFNAMNFIDITAGDYNNNGHETLVVWACASTPTLKEVTCNVSSGSISLSIRDGDGYIQDNDKTLFIRSYKDTDDRYVYNRIHGAIDTGDINGDGIDDLVVLSYVNRVHDDYRKNQLTEYYLPTLSVCYGVDGSSTAIVKGENAVRRKYACWSDGYEWRVAPAAAGLAVGDVNGDGRDEVVVAGFYHKIKGILGQNVKTSYDTLDPTKLVVCIHGKDLNQLLADTEQSTNKWTQGGATYGGLYLRDSTEGDHSWQQTGVETVAINGPASPEHIFINGTLYTFQGSKLSPVYTDDYFKEADQGMDGMFTEETYIRSMAVGNFDGNEEGYEQIAFVIGAADSNNVGNAKYTQAMIGGVYEKDGNVFDTAVDYFCTTPYSIRNNYYPNSSSSCEVNDVLSYELTAWDTDSDGLRVKYIGKTFNYSDPAVMAVLQAPPYFEEIKDAMTGYETAYTISTSYSYATGEGKSTSFSIGAELEVEAEVVKLNAGLSYATSWEKTFTKELTTSDEYSFTAIGEDQVVLYRTPVTTYIYQVEVNGNFSDANTTSLSFPGVPSKAIMSVSDYNAFVDYYNAENKRRAEKAGLTGTVPQMKKITDKYLGNEGNPFGYRSDTDDLSNVTILQSTPNSFEMGSSSTGYAWSQEHSSSEEETMEHGFSFEFSLMFQLRSPVGHTGVGLAIKTSLEYMESTSVSTTNAKGKGIGCTVGNMDPDSLSEMNISRETANQYGFSYQLASWPSGIKSVENLEDWETEDDGPTTQTVDVPIYGYILSGVKAGPPAVTDLFGEIERNDDNEMIIKLSWSDPSSEGRTIGGYTLYVEEKDGSLTEVATVGADTTEYVFKDLDGRYSYTFMVRAKKNISDSAGSVDSNRVTLYLGAPSIYSIELKSSDEKQDVYTIVYTDGTKTELVISHGATIVDITLKEEGENVDVYLVRCADGSEITFEVRHGKSAYEIAVEHGYTGTEAEWIASLTGNGIGVKEIKYLSTSEDGIIDTYAIVFTDGSYYTFTVTNGLKGDQGETGNGIKSIEKKETSEDGITDTYVITYTDGRTETFTVVNGRDGADGLSAYDIAVLNGYEGTVAQWVAELRGSGVGVEDIKKTGSSEDGRIDTYTIFYTDGSSYTFTVTNGADGNGIKSVEKKNGNLIITTTDGKTVNVGSITGKDGKNGLDGADGADGKDGTDGKDGKDGAGITGVKIDDDGNLIVTLSDGTAINAGNVSKAAKNADSVPWWMLAWNTALTAGVGYSLVSGKKKKE